MVRRQILRILGFLPILPTISLSLSDVNHPSRLYGCLLFLKLSLLATPPYSCLQGEP